MILHGKNLGERHRDLNSEVSKAAAKLTNFEKVKSQPEKSDVDKLFKIDLASKYRNIDYILDVLKCGDDFHISRALKCLWMYKDEYSQFLNIDYLKANIFPYMSRKIKTKMLTAISMHVRNADRLIDFYRYCIDARLNDYALKFLLVTPDAFKLNAMETGSFIGLNNSKLIKQFIGNSFELALAFLELHDYSSSIIRDLHFLYSVSQKEYLKILENIRNEANYPYCSRRLGIRISKSILTKHKHRVMNNSVLYVNILHKGMLVRHLTTEDVETIAPDLLPEHSRDYWTLNFYNTYKFILENIPANRLCSYMKQIFVSKYRRVEFKMNIEFYRLQYYEMLNIGEREAWALRHIERDKELPGIKNYMWYKFVSFEKAFSGIKRYIFLTPDKDERSRIVNILPETARNQKDVKKILNYYYGRHFNESETHKESFINKITETHDIYSFNDECWMIFDKLLYSLNVYDSETYDRSEYKVRSLFYRILHDKNIPKVLTEYCDKIDFCYIRELIDELSEERKAIVVKFLLNSYAEIIKKLMDDHEYDAVSDEYYWEFGNIKRRITEYVSTVWSILYAFKRPNEDCPAIVIQFLDSNKKCFHQHEIYKVKFEKKNDCDFVRWLKQDNEMAVGGISEIRCNAYRWDFKLCRLFRKLKVYFANDIAKEYLNYFMQYLSDVPEGRLEYRNIKTAVVGVYYLADQESILYFLEKNVPTSPKIDRTEIDNRVLQVQKAICRLAYHARPPLPLSIILKYITGDYVHYCLPTFYNYFANLPSSIKFIDSLLDAPLSIQKHGLRFACRAYDAETLSPIIIGAWKKTKNVSLRMVLYETLFNRILEGIHKDQEKLYQVIKLYTTELNHDDHDNVYSLLVTDDFPDAFKSDFIETSWRTVNKLPDKSVDIQRRITVIHYMEKYIHQVQRDFVRCQIIDTHVKDMLSEKNISRDCDKFDFQELTNAKWQLTAKYIVSFNGEVEQQKSLELIQTIMTEIVRNWNLVKGKTYILRKFMDGFITTIMDKDPKTIESCVTMAPIYQFIVNYLKSFLKTEEMYLLNWKLKLSLTCRDIIHNEMNGETETDSDESSDMASEEIAHSYGKAVAKMIVRSGKNDNFFYSFYESIAEIVNNVGVTICDILDIDSIGFVYFVCEGLIKTKMTETHLLALFMLPKDPYGDWDREHSKIITDIKGQCVSQEVRCFLYEKYMLQDYKIRHYMA